MQVSLVELAVQFIVLITLYAMAHRNSMNLKKKKTKSQNRWEPPLPTPPEDYCRKELCPPNIKHIACNNPFWGPNCKKPRAGVNMDVYRYPILDLHNNLRNRITCLQPLKNLPQSNFIPKLNWDLKLSILAMRITNFCNDEIASQCANTSLYPDVAKSMYSLKLTSSNVNIRGFLEHVILETWFKHYTTIGPSFVYSFPLNASRQDHEFANILNKRVTRFGCGMLIQKEKMIYLTCLYSERMKPLRMLYSVAIH